MTEKHDIRDYFPLSLGTKGTLHLPGNKATTSETFQRFHGLQHHFNRQPSGENAINSQKNSKEENSTSLFGKIRKSTQNMI